MAAQPYPSRRRLCMAAPAACARRRYRCRPRFPERIARQSGRQGLALMARQKIALVGIGKIARDQHVPALAASPDWELAATVSRAGSVDGIESYTDFAAMLAARPDIGTVSLCMPPVPRFAYAEAALKAGRHVMLEKPPGATLAEVHALTALAAANNLTLYATWHSRMAHGVAPAKAWLADATLTFPENRQTPIAAALAFSGNVTADFDWSQEGPQTWDIVVETTSGSLTLHMGGSQLSTSDGLASSGPDREYPNLYAHMATLVRDRRSDVDLAPMTHVADALTLGRRDVTEAFHF